MVRPIYKRNDFWGGIYDSEAVEYAYQALEGKRPLDLESLEEVCPYLKEGEVSELARKAWKDEAITCICSYIDMRNVLTDEELQKVQGYVSEENFYRVVEYNGKQK